METQRRRRVSYCEIVMVVFAIGHDDVFVHRYKYRNNGLLDILRCLYRKFFRMYPHKSRTTYNRFTNASNETCNNAYNTMPSLDEINGSDAFET